MNLNEIAVFVKVVEAGSFVGAATLLGLPKSTVSSRFGALEARLGVTLIRRTTRKLHVTDAGLAYYQKCLRALSEIQSAEAEIVSGQATPQGILRVTAPVELGVTLLPRVITEFNKKFPQVDVEVILSDQTVDLLGDGIDLGIRAGTLRDSSLVARKLGSVYFAPFASQKYLRNNPEPRTPKDIDRHCVIQFAPLGSVEWNLVGAKDRAKVRLRRKLVVNDLNLVKALTEAGLGVALIPTFLCYQEARAGKLVRILGNWRTQTRPVHLVYPSQRFAAPKLRAFLEVATPLLKESLSVAEL